jgi:hypothetical protein
MAPNKTIVAMLVIIVAMAACVPAVTSSETPAENKVLTGTTQGGASTSSGIHYDPAIMGALGSDKNALYG